MNSPHRQQLKEFMETSEEDDLGQAESRGRCNTWPVHPFPGQQHSSQHHTCSSSPTSSMNTSLCSSSVGFHQPRHPSASLLYHSSQQQQNQSMGGGQSEGGCTRLPSIGFLRGSSSSYLNHLAGHMQPRQLFFDPLPSSNSTQQQMTSGEDEEEDEELEESSQKPESEQNNNNSMTTAVKKKRVRKRNPETVSQKKPNPWGEESYSDLIARALTFTPDGRLKLNEIYQWFSENIPYFRDRSSQEEAQGWKNSIRHNLSLHSRFMRIQNEGAGKSSWWVINPDAKPGRNPRRRAATMETATKGIIDKKRRGARKRVEGMGLGRGGPLHSAGTSVMSSQASILSQDYECDDVVGAGSNNFESFRPRTQSTLSIPGTFEGTPLASRPPLSHPASRTSTSRPGWTQSPEWAQLWLALASMSAKSWIAPTR